VTYGAPPRPIEQDAAVAEVGLPQARRPGSAEPTLPFTSMMREPAWPPDFFAWKPGDWSALGTCVTALVAIIAALFAWRQVREARRLRQEQTQPYVAVTMETSAAAQNIVDLVVKNFGTTAAYDVSVSIDPPPQRSGASGEVEDVSVPKIFRTMIPGQEWRTFFG
jgi:hypothetical protein